MGDRVVRADGVGLEGGRMLQEVMRPAEAHTFEVVRDASPLPSESAQSHPLCASSPQAASGHYLLSPPYAPHSGAAQVATAQAVAQAAAAAASPYGAAAAHSAAMAAYLSLIHI